MPEQAPLYYESFDEGYLAGQTNSELLIPGLGTLEESWSGYALQRLGDVVPFVVPAVDPTGHTNVSCDTGGAFRFWIKPYWSSESEMNGTGPGATATVLELDAVSGAESALAWSLQISGDGNTLGLFAETASGLQQVLQSQIAWQAGESHLLALDYSPQGTTLYVDGSVAAQGFGLPSIPPSAGQLVIGSTLAGNNAAGSDFDEFYSFNRLLTDSAVGWYYTMTSGQAALGPISDDEQAQRLRPHRRLDSAMELTPVYDPDNDTPCSPGGPVCMTNVFATLQTNGTTSVSLEIFGGTNGVLYDVFSTTVVTNTLSNHQWNWIGQGLTCNTYTFSNQPADQSFYVLEAPAQTMTVAFGNNGNGQCNVPAGLSNSIATAAGGFFTLALQNNGTVLAWGDNTHGQTNVPSGITNAVSIAAGQYHGLALLANGSVQSWGSYCDGANFYSVTNYSGLSGPPTSNVMAIAAGLGHDLALMSNGTVVAWGLTNLYATSSNALAFQTNLTGVKAIACGWNHNVALLSNGLVQAWGLNAASLGWNLTNVPGDLTNAVAIAAFGLHSVALRSNGTVEAWGYSPDGETNVPVGLSNVVAIAAGGLQSLALQANGTVVIWGQATLTNIPLGLTAAKTISGGFEHNLVLQSDLLTPIILQEPTDQYSLAGSNATFSVQAESLARVQYQWQFNSVNLTGATNSTLTLANTQTNDNGSYQVVVSTEAASISSSIATFTLVEAPEISTGFTAPTNIWINTFLMLSPGVTAAGQSKYPVGYQWELNGTNITNSPDSYTIYPTAAADGDYTLVVTNVAGSNSVTWDVRVALPGMVEAWGDDTYGECDRPASLTNASAIAAGDYHSVAVTDSGSVLQWGEYSDGANFYAVGSPPSFTNVVAVAASRGHDLALKADGTVTNWGLTNDVANSVPTNLASAKAIAAGWEHNVALLTNGTVKAWGDNSYGQTNVPSDLTNAIAIAAGGYHSLALRANGTVEPWGDTNYGLTNIPSGLSNVVAIATGGEHSLALKSDGTVVAWGTNDFGQTNVPAGMSNVMAIAAGSAHSVALQNDGALVEWGNNGSGQAIVPSEETNTVITPSGPPPPIPTNTYPPIHVKLIAAGGNHTMAAIFSPLVQYPIDISKDLLLIYNATNISFSSNVCAYYIAHRPMVSNANVLGISCATNEIIQLSNYTNTFSAPIVNWLLANPTKRPQYVILFQDLPSRIQIGAGGVSVQYDINSGFNDPYIQTTEYFPTWNPFVTSINMNGTGGTNDCIAYIDKLANMASNYSPGTLFISATAGGYGNTNWYFDEFLTNLIAAVTNVDPSAPVFTTIATNFNTNATNVAGYYICGYDCNFDADFATDGAVQFFGNSGWYVMSTVDSFNGQRSTFQSGFLTWWATNSFGGTNYSNTPVGAIVHVDEPGPGEENRYTYYGSWASEKSFAITAWYALYTSPGGTFLHCAVVGDPFVTK